MSELLKNGQTVQAVSGGECKILKFLGGGGQGEVYKVEWSGGEYALKWYYQQAATKEQRQALEELVKQGPPSDRFLWPLDLAQTPGVPGYGYLMRLRPPEFKDLNDLMADRIKPLFMTLIRAGLELAKSFRLLHHKGLAYRDISFGNVFFNPATGDVLVCDNDNVAVDTRAQDSGVTGTPAFMAPEIVIGKAKPSTKTDLHSLAVLLFYMLFRGHPLEGKKLLKIRVWDIPAREKIHGKEPLFIFDPTDSSNEALDKSVDPTGETGGNALVYWKIYPKAFREIFTKAFTRGLRDPDQRVTELEWLKILSALRDSLFKCECGASNFYDGVTTGAGVAQANDCWRCKKSPRYPFRLCLPDTLVMLNADTRLFPHHVGMDRERFDFTKPVAEVSAHPTRPDVWGLKNLGSTRWVATFQDSTLKDIDPGRSVPLATKVKIAFGRVDGEVQY